MPSREWTTTAIQKLYKLKFKSKQTLLNAESRGEIPQSTRISRGSTKVRIWQIEDLPIIGKKYGFLKKPNQFHSLCFYTAKGGVLKTTIAYEFARILALNGIKVLVIGLDIQCSITDILIPPDEENIPVPTEKKPIGLYHYLYEGANLSQIIVKTEIPTLDVIMETPELNILEKKIRDEKRREYIFKDILIEEAQQEYDLIIYDNGPSWNMLIENALVSSDIIFSPISCELGTYNALQTNLTTLHDFIDAMRIRWKLCQLIPTLLDKTKLSQHIYGLYLTQYENDIISAPIRRAIKGQEAHLLKKSAIEHDPNSPLAQDYYDLLQQAWDKIINIDLSQQSPPVNKRRIKTLTKVKQTSLKQKVTDNGS